MSFLLLNGLNLNMLGSRARSLRISYFRKIISDVKQRVLARYAVESYQSNAEHLLIERVQAAKGEKIHYY